MCWMGGWVAEWLGVMGVLSWLGVMGVMGVQTFAVRGCTTDRSQTELSAHKSGAGRTVRSC